MKEEIINYLNIEVGKIKDDRTIVSATDVLESIFGKYKRFSSRCPLKEFRQMFPVMLYLNGSMMFLNSLCFPNEKLSLMLPLMTWKLLEKI